MATAVSNGWESRMRLVQHNYNWNAGARAGKVRSGIRPLNATEAARRAGYSPKTARQTVFPGLFIFEAGLCLSLPLLAGCWVIFWFPQRFLLHSAFSLGL